MHQAYEQSPRRDSLNKRIIAAVAVAILVGCAVVLYVITRTESPEAVVAQAPTAPRQSGDRPEFPEAPQAVPPHTNPTFDVVRVSREGNAVIAGRASPGSEVTVHAGEDVVGTVKADDRGEWVLAPAAPLESGSHPLSLRALDEEGETAKSDDVVVVMIPARETLVAGNTSHVTAAEVTVHAGEDVVGTVKADDRGEWVLVPEAPLESGSHPLSLRALDEEGETAKSDDVVVGMIPARETLVAGNTSHVTAAAPRQVIAVAAPRMTFGASRVLQGPTISPNVLSGDAVQLSTVNYDEQGRLVLSGFALPASQVRVKVDGRSIGATIADDTGYWELTPARAVAIGDHTLWVASIDGADKIIASTALPFTRADIVEANLRPGEFHFTVQPGNSLWRIARAAYGQGILYTVIYSANAEKIKEPDLIYPGQILTMPPQN